MAKYKTLLFCAPAGRDATPLSATSFIPVAGSTSVAPFNGAETANWSSCNINTAGVISNLAAQRGAAAGGSDTLALRVNGVNTALAVTAAAPDDFAENTDDAVAIAQGGPSGGDVAQYDHTNSASYRWIRAHFEPEEDETQVSVFATRGDGALLGAYLASSTGTNYLAFCGGGAPFASINTNETLARVKVKTAGSFKNVAVHVVYNIAGSAVTLRSRVNGVDGNIAITIAAGSTGRKFDFTNSDDLVVDDEFCFSVSAPSSGRVEFVLLTSEYHHSAPNGDHDIYCGLPGQTVTLPASASAQYYTPAGDLDAYSSESDAAVTFGMTSGAKKFRMKVTTNTCSNDQVFTVMKDGVATALAFTVGAGLAGDDDVFIDDIDEISLLATSTISVRQSGGGTGGLGVEYFAMVVPGDVGEEVPSETGECGEEDEADELQTAISWPKCDLKPGSINVQVVSPSVSPGRSFAGIEQIVQPDPGHWRIILRDIRINTKARALQWREIESGLSGRANPILVPVYEVPLSDEPIVATSSDGSIGATSVVIFQTAGEDIQAGMHFSTPGHWLHRITSVEAVDDLGTVTAVFFPPLREALEPDDELEFNDPVCRCRLESDDGMDVSLALLRYSSPTVSFVEAV